MARSRSEAIERSRVVSAEFGWAEKCLQGVRIWQLGQDPIPACFGGVCGAGVRHSAARDSSPWLRSAGSAARLTAPESGLGGDGDTVGATMAGALAGAAAGPDAAPGRWRVFEGYPEILRWAEALGGLRESDDLPDPVELEKRLCALVRGGGQEPSVVR